MSVKISFEPKRLAQSVNALAARIGKPTGEPVRLDMLAGLEALRKYCKTRNPAHLPTKMNIERASHHINLVIEEDLLNCFTFCLTKSGSNAGIQLRLVLHYFSNFTNTELAEYLNKSIENYVIPSVPWSRWRDLKDVIFTETPIQKMLKAAGLAGIKIQDLATFWGLEQPYRIREECYDTLAGDQIQFKEYIIRLEPVEIENMLNLGSIEHFHVPIWNIVLPLYHDQAKALLKRNGSEHRLFTLAKLRLNPPSSAKWLRLSKEAQYAYKDWAIGSQLESIFNTDSSNSRIVFWKSRIMHIDRVHEVKYREDVGALVMSIGKYDFVEFREIGAIYVYPRDSITFPGRVTDLARLKFRDRVIHYNSNSKEGWIPHLGNTWASRAEALIKEAISK